MYSFILLSLLSLLIVPYSFTFSFLLPPYPALTQLIYLQLIHLLFSFVYQLLFQIYGQYKFTLAPNEQRVFKGFWQDAFVKVCFSGVLLMYENDKIVINRTISHYQSIVDNDSFFLFVPDGNVCLV